MAEVKLNVDNDKLIPNSGVSKVNKKSDDKHVEKVVKGKVQKKKKSVTKRVVDAFVGEDVGDVKSYLLFDVLIPAVKNTTSDLISQGVNMILFGDARRGGNTRRDGSRSYVSYDSYSSRNNSRNNRYASYNRRAAMEFDDILFEHRDDAEMALSSLFDLVDEYGSASVADLYDLVGTTGSYTDRGYGWTDLSNSSVLRVRDGYILDLPKVRSL